MHDKSRNNKCHLNEQDKLSNRVLLKVPEKGNVAIDAKLRNLQAVHDILKGPNLRLLIVRQQILIFGNIRAIQFLQQGRASLLLHQSSIAHCPLIIL
jgi:hypothetical protein